MSEFESRDKGLASPASAQSAAYGGMTGDQSQSAVGQSSELMGGLQPGAKAGEEELGGIKNKLSDAADSVGTGVGNVVGGLATAAAGVAISTADTLAASWSPDAEFAWDIGFSTTGKNGWIVQKIDNTFNMEAADGTKTDISGTGIVPSYYEAWAVDGASVVSPSNGATNDMWRRPARTAGGKGRWSMRGKCYWTTTDPATKGMAPGNVANAGILMSSVGSPGGLGTARLHRHANGTWDSTGAAPVHTGSAV